MQRIEWSEKYKIDIKELDKQHIILFGLFNELLDVMILGKNKDIMEEALQELLDYATIHFTTEEKYLRKYQYPDIRKHQKEHKDFFDSLYDFQKKLKKQQHTPSIEIVKFLNNWIASHTQFADKHYSPYLTGKGAK